MFHVEQYRWGWRQRDAAWLWLPSRPAPTRAGNRCRPIAGGSTYDCSQRHCSTLLPWLPAAFSRMRWLSGGQRAPPTKCSTWNMSIGLVATDASMLRVVGLRPALTDSHSGRVGRCQVDRWMVGCTEHCSSLFPRLPACPLGCGGHLANDACTVCSTWNIPLRLLPGFHLPLLPARRPPQPL